MNSIEVSDKEATTMANGTQLLKFASVGDESFNGVQDSQSEVANCTPFHFEPAGPMSRKQ